MDEFDVSALIPEFRAEARQHLAALESGLLALEAAPESDARREIVNTIFRSAHTIKGSARLMGFGNVGDLAHALEDVLAAVRDGRRPVDAPLLDALLKAVDHLRQAVEQSPDYAEGFAETAAGLRGALAAAPGADDFGWHDAPAPAPAPEPAPAPPVAPAPDDEFVRVAAARLDELMSLTAELLMVGQLAHELDGRGLQLAQGAEEMLRALAGPQAGPATDPRVLLDGITAWRLAQGEATRLLVATTERLEQEVMELRLLPLDTLFASLPRLVRDLAREHGKQVELTITGQSTGLDRRLVQGLGEPLLHLLRNAVDHGLEPAAERVQAGKPAAGQVRVRAFRQGGRVRIEIADDGRGIAPQTLRAAAVRRGLLGQVAAAALDDTAALELIYHPGFSTAAAVTDTSGRGVGMGVVRAAIAGLGGSLELWSQPGAGTRWTLNLPLTLTIARALLVEAAGRTYALPAASVDSVVRLRPETVQNGAGQPHALVDGVPVPLAALSAVLGGAAELALPCPALVVAFGDQRGALAVDRIMDEREIVLKPLGDFLSRGELAAAAALLPNGQVAVVLDPAACLRAARGARRGRPTPAPPAGGRPRRRILVVEDSAVTRELERSILIASGYEVETAVDGAEGLEKAQAGSFDLVLTDVEMPRLNGFELTAALRADARLAGLPVVVLTGLTNEAERRRGLQAGAQAYLSKSTFDQAVFLETIERLLA